MPISRTHFELGITGEIEDWMKKIYTFLAENEEMAYTQEEIADALGVKEVNGWATQGELKAIELFGKALEMLDAIDCIESREIGGIHYFAIGPRRDLEKLLSVEVPPLLR